MSNLRLINETTASSVSSVEITDVFNADFDIYKITATNIDSTTEDYLYFKFINASGSKVSSANYDYASLYLRSYNTFNEPKATNSTEWDRFAVQDDETSDGGGVTAYIFNPYSSSSYSFALNQHQAQGSLGAIGLKGIMVLKQTASMKGFCVYPNSGTLDNITLRTYGLRVDS